MIFSSEVFILSFLPIVYVLNCIIPKKCSNVLLFVASILFYAYSSDYFLIVLVFSYGCHVVNFRKKSLCGSGKCVEFVLILNEGMNA